MIRYLKRTERLCDDDWHPHWLLHPRYDNTADVACLSLGRDDEAAYWTINDARKERLFDADFRLRPGLDVFVLGFPLDIAVEHHLAIWKRGTIASEPEFNVNGKPIILIDTATRSSMSGAPVIAQIQGVWGSWSGNAVTDDTKFGTGGEFIGIYSGRLGTMSLKRSLV